MCGHICRKTLSYLQPRYNDLFSSVRWHAEFDMEPYRNELESLQLHLVASEFAQSEAGYLEGALSAADLAVHTFKI